MESKLNSNFGIQDCSKCEYKLRCEECTYSKKAEEVINEIYQELYIHGKMYASPENLDTDNFGIFYLTQKIVENVAKNHNIKIK